MPTKTRGFRLGRRLVKVFSRCIRRRKPVSYQRLHLQQPVGPISMLKKWVRSLRSGRSGYLRVKDEPVVKSPKGHLAVYVGEKEEDTCRVMVPIIYFNHPLFGELLKEAEKVYGFDHPGGIQIPCQRSELENVQMKIAAVTVSGRKWAMWT